MKIVIDSTVLEEDGFTLTEFSVILYYLAGGSGVINKELCENLREKGFLKRVLDGYAFHEGKKSKIRTWMVKSSTSSGDMDRLTSLAAAMQAEFPEGKKEGTNLYWRDSTKVIAQRLAMFIRKYGDHPDEDFINAAKEYVASNNSRTIMQVLKYFIYKKNIESGEENSQLSSYLDNKNQQSFNSDWRDSVR